MKLVPEAHLQKPQAAKSSEMPRAPRKLRGQRRRVRLVLRLRGPISISESPCGGFAGFHGSASTCSEAESLASNGLTNCFDMSPGIEKLGMLQAGLFPFHGCFALCKERIHSTTRFCLLQSEPIVSQGQHDLLFKSMHLYNH